MIILIHKISSHKYFIQMAGPAFTRIHRLVRTMIVCSGRPFINFCFSVSFLPITKRNSLFHPEKFYVPAAGMYVPRCWNVEFSLAKTGNHRGVCTKCRDCLAEKSAVPPLLAWMLPEMRTKNQPPFTVNPVKTAV